MITMPLMPFVFDRSPMARLVKAIDSPGRQLGQLKQLQRLMTEDIYKVPYGYLDQARRRSALMLPITNDEDERQILHDIYMTAFRRIQRIHMESRP